MLIAKRFFDVVISGFALLVTLPLLIGGSVAVKLTSPGPALYRARRAGRGGKPFEMLKFRTMYLGTDSLDRRVTALEDERITPAGKFLRKSKIDELPQLWNVLRGDMSIIGPRPEDWDIVERYYTREQRRVLEYRPGLASAADVHWYPDISYHDPPPPGASAQEWYVRRHIPILVSEALQCLERETVLLDFRISIQVLLCILVHLFAQPKKLVLLPENQRDEVVLQNAR